MEPPAWDMVARGSLQWLPARVMSDLPRWHTQRCGRCQNSRYLYGQRRGLPPRRQLPVRPEHDRVQSCAIALRSPASERPSDLNRYSPDIHDWRNTTSDRSPDSTTPTHALTGCMPWKPNRSGSRMSLRRSKESLATPKAKDADRPQPAEDGQRFIARPG